MKKIITTLFALAMLSLPAIAEVNSNTMNPFVVTMTSAALNLYIVGGSTTSLAQYTVHADSITFYTEGGLYPGTTQYVFADTNKDTLKEFVDFLNAVPITTVGAEGGIIAAIPNGVYDKNLTSELTVSASTTTSIKGLAAKKTLYLNNMLGMSYTLPANQLYVNHQYHVTTISPYAAFTSGTFYLRIYDGTAYTNNQLFHYLVGDAAATYEDSPIISMPGDFAGSKQTAMRFDLECSSWTTSAYLNITGYKK